MRSSSESTITLTLTQEEVNEYLRDANKLGSLLSKESGEGGTLHYRHPAIYAMYEELLKYASK